MALRSIRTRPSSIKRNCDRRVTSTGQSAWCTGHAKSRLIPEISADTPARNQGSGRSLAGPDAGHPLQGAGGHGGRFHDPEYARNDLDSPGDERSSPSRQDAQTRKMWSAASGAVSVHAACKPICKPDAPGWDETEETEQNKRAVLVPVRRGHRIRGRSSKTPETYVVVLITQRRQYLPHCSAPKPEQ
jgi:hypothetical protein